jgi:CheY-like chemotaxis protein
MSSRRREILCIDDDLQGLKVRGILLESMGYKVLTEPDAERGLRTFQNHAVDAVVMDYQMPGMSGGDAAVEMKRLRPQVPVLILSALQWLPEGAPSEAIDGFVQKGEPLGVLARRIEQVMSGHDDEPGVAETVGSAIGNFVGHVAQALRPRNKVPVN